MLQRMLLAGGQARLHAGFRRRRAEVKVRSIKAQQWAPVDTTRPKDVRSQAGVYQSGNRLLAVNRPVSEDEPEILDSDATRKSYLAASPVQTLQEKPFRKPGQLQGEVWRMFVFAMLLFLLAEAILILPPRRAAPASVAAPAKTREREAQLV